MSALPDQAGEALSTIVGFLLRSPEENGPSAADRAALRRMDPLEASFPPAMWKLLTHEHVTLFTALVKQAARAEQALAIVAQAVLEGGAPGGSAVGRALGESRYAEQRFVRLLRARILPHLAYEVRQAARWCSAHGLGLRFTDTHGQDGFGGYVLAVGLGLPEAEWRTRAIARDYYSAVHKAGEPATTTTTTEV